MGCQGFYCVYCGVFLEGWLYIVSVEVLTLCVHAEVAVVDAIDIDHRYDHEYKHFPQQFRPEIILIHQKINNPLNSIRRR